MLSDLLQNLVIGVLHSGINSVKWDKNVNSIYYDKYNSIMRWLIWLWLLWSWPPCLCPLWTVPQAIVQTAHAQPWLQTPQQQIIQHQSDGYHLHRSQSKLQTVTQHDTFRFAVSRLSLIMAIMRLRRRRWDNTLNQKKTTCATVHSIDKPNRPTVSSNMVKSVVGYECIADTDWWSWANTVHWAQVQMGKLQILLRFWDVWISISPGFFLACYLKNNWLKVPFICSYHCNQQMISLHFEIDPSRIKVTASSDVWNKFINNFFPVWSIFYPGWSH